MSRDSVGLEIATVSLPVDGEEMLRQIHRKLDELVMDPQMRRDLNSNGIRCGLLGTQLPKSIHELLRQAEHERLHPTAESAARGFEVQRFLQCRAGRKYDVSLGNPVDRFDLDYFQAGIASKKKFEDARCLFAIRCFSVNSNGVTLELTPEVEHGPLRQNWVSNGGTFHVETTRKREAFDLLRMNVPLRHGETMLITSIPESNGLGNALFVHPETNRQRLLLVRLAQTQAEELFRAKETAPLTTTEE
jgi:hypothetical protein